jgi:hypothetical protein
MRGKMLRRLIGLLALCLVVGLVMAALGATPRSLLFDFWRTIGNLFWTAVDLVSWFIRVAVQLGGWLGPYVLLGASVVVPIAIVVAALKYLRRS